MQVQAGYKPDRRVLKAESESHLGRKDTYYSGILQVDKVKGLLLSSDDPSTRCMIRGNMSMMLI
jgi:hypothetical protein